MIEERREDPIRNGAGQLSYNNLSGEYRNKDVEGQKEMRVKRRRENLQTAKYRKM